MRFIGEGAKFTSINVLVGGTKFDEFANDGRKRLARFLASEE